MEDGQLHKVMTGCGYRYMRARNLPEKSMLYSKVRGEGYYTKEYTTDAGNFNVALVIRPDPFTELPIAFIIEQPEQFQNCLMPHVALEGFLCYVDQMEADWDSNDLAGTYKEIDAQIHLTLINSVSAATKGLNDKRELEGEFAAYWQPSETLFLLSNASRGTRLKTSLAKSLMSDGTTRQEYITVEESSPEDSEAVITKWLKQRYFPRNSLKEFPINTHYIAVNPSRLAGMKWPPVSFRDLLEWLEKSDHNARDRVIEHIKAEGKKRYIFLFDVLNQDIFAIYVEFNTQSVDFRRHKKSAKNSTVKLATMLGGKNVCTEYQRLGVTRADITTLLSRNARREGTASLSEKRIALIGCGTIGGYLAELLLRNGAGCGKGLLHIYDSDIYKPSNFGRHTLSSHDFGSYKSLSLAARLQDSLHLQTKIVGFNKQFRINTDVMQKYDIIIDATGRPPVSKRIAAVVRNIPREQRPFIIHAFNDGNGWASKVFIDDGRSCYGCMVSNPEKYHDGTDLRFIALDISSETNKSCGSSYTLYDAAVSNITASLAQMAVLSTLEPELKWTYNEHVLEGGRSFRPQFLPHQPNCSVCNEHK
ncbi:ThiF family adenylyltransferase [Enterobacter roggenkampii]|uniref:E2/UBC family protein n=1 Tax=Enterobacter roggenkampii TaxID=1812935 RepID=UPI00200563D8|nr:E2/UBC family protein [Enterobacter roggenkampii]MCK7077696.1 ThiF family adenylyltransferase [Enterobacter roggenkampii]